LIALLAVSNVMCGLGARDFDADSFTKVKPTRQQMAGVYVPTKETVTLIEQTGHYHLNDIAISLFKDGTFDMQNMPDWWIADFGVSKGKGDSGKGKWQIVKHGTLWQIEFGFETGEFNSDKNLSNGFFTTKDMSGDSPPYSLWFYIGDPDKGRVMIFEQVLEK